MNSYDTKTWAWEAQINALKSELDVQAAEIRKLRAALELWQDAVKVHVMMEGPMFVSVMNRPAKLAWDNARAALAQGGEK